MGGSQPYTPYEGSKALICMALGLGHSPERCSWSDNQTGNRLMHRRQLIAC